MKDKNPVDFEIRKLKVWEVPELLRFRSKYDYKIPFLLNPGGRRESVAYHVLKILWHRDRMTTFVAMRGREVLGYISIIFGKYKKFYGNAYLVSAAVKKGERGKGLGSALFDTVEEYARLRGARRIEFDVFAQNERALKLYKRLGYEVEGVKRKAVENEFGSDDLIFMAKFL